MWGFKWKAQKYLKLAPRVIIYFWKGSGFLAIFFNLKNSQNYFHKSCTSLKHIFSEDWKIRGEKRKNGIFKLELITYLILKVKFWGNQCIICFDNYTWSFSNNLVMMLHRGNAEVKGIWSSSDVRFLETGNTIKSYKLLFFIPIQTLIQPMSLLYFPSCPTLSIEKIYWQDYLAKYNFKPVLQNILRKKNDRY